MSAFIPLFHRPDGEEPSGPGRSPANEETSQHPDDQETHGATDQGGRRTDTQARERGSPAKQTRERRRSYTPLVREYIRDGQKTPPGQERCRFERLEGHCPWSCCPSLHRLVERPTIRQVVEGLLPIIEWKLQSHDPTGETYHGEDHETRGRRGGTRYEYVSTEEPASDADNDNDRSGGGPAVKRKRGTERESTAGGGKKRKRGAEGQDLRETKGEDPSVKRVKRLEWHG